MFVVASPPTVQPVASPPQTAGSTKAAVISPTAYVSFAFQKIIILFLFLIIYSVLTLIGGYIVDGMVAVLYFAVFLRVQILLMIVC